MLIAKGAAMSPTDNSPRANSRSTIARLVESPKALKTVSKEGRRDVVTANPFLFHEYVK